MNSSGASFRPPRVVVPRKAAVHVRAPLRVPARGRASSAEVTRHLLMETARRAFSERGYTRTTVQDILQGTGLSRGAFYRYFGSVDEVFVAVINAVVDELVNASRVHTGSTQRERVLDGNRRYLQLFAQHRGAMRALAEAALVNPQIEAIQSRMRSAYLRRLRDHLQRQCAKGLCHDIDPDASTLSLGMMVEGAAMSWVVTGLEPFEQPLDLERLCSEVTDIWCRAVYLDPDRALVPHSSREAMPHADQ